MNASAPVCKTSTTRITRPHSTTTHRLLKPNHQLPPPIASSGNKDACQVALSTEPGANSDMCQPATTPPLCPSSEAPPPPARTGTPPETAPHGHTAMSRPSAGPAALAPDTDGAGRGQGAAGGELSCSRHNRRSQPAGQQAQASFRQAPASHCSTHVKSRGRARQTCCEAGCGWWNPNCQTNTDSTSWTSFICVTCIQYHHHQVYSHTMGFTGTDERPVLQRP